MAFRENHIPFRVANVGWNPQFVSIILQTHDSEPGNAGGAEVRVTGINFDLDVTPFPFMGADPETPFADTEGSPLKATGPAIVTPITFEMADFYEAIRFEDFFVVGEDPTGQFGFMVLNLKKIVPDTEPDLLRFRVTVNAVRTADYTVEVRYATSVRVSETEVAIGEPLSTAILTTSAASFDVTVDKPRRHVQIN